MTKREPSLRHIPLADAHDDSPGVRESLTTYLYCLIPPVSRPPHQQRGRARQRHSSATGNSSSDELSLLLWQTFTTMAAPQEQQHLSALSYIDKDYDDPRMKQIVHSLIEEEMAAFEPPDYLADKPAPRTRFQSPLLKSEWARVRAEKAMEPMDTSRYDLQPPQGAAAENETAWKRSLDNARAQTEHQHNRWVYCALRGLYSSIPPPFYIGLCIPMSASNRSSAVQT